MITTAYDMYMWMCVLRSSALWWSLRTCSFLNLSAQDFLGQLLQCVFVREMGRMGKEGSGIGDVCVEDTQDAQVGVAGMTHE